MKRSWFVPPLLVVGLIAAWLAARDDVGERRADRRNPIQSDGMGRGEGKDGPAGELPPPSAETFRLRVLVRDEKSMRPMEGAVVSVAHGPDAICRVPDVVTDAHGRTVLAGPADEIGSFLWIRAPGETPQPWLRREVYELENGATSVEFLIPFARTIRWQILPGKFGIPASGTRIELIPVLDPDAMTPPPFATMRGEWLIASGWSGSYAEARALGPNGTVAALEESGEDDLGEPTVFVRGRSVEVTLRDAAGTPAPGRSVLMDHDGGGGVARSNQRGRVRFEMVPSAFATLHVHRAEDVLEWIGRVDLREQDARIVHSLQQPSRLNLRLVSDHGLPEFSGAFLKGLDDESFFFDPRTGRLTGQVFPPRGTRSLRLDVRSSDFHDAETTLSVPAPDGVWSHDVPVRRLGRLRIEVRGELPKWSCDFELVRVGSDRPVNGRVIRGNKVDGYCRTARPGLYRLITRSCEAVVGSAQVQAGETAVISFDGSDVQLITCWVATPGSIGQGGSWVQISGGGFDSYLQRSHGDTHYGYVHRENRYRLSAHHPFLAPHPEQGFSEGKGGRRSIELKLVKGPAARFSVPPGFGPVEFVLLYVGEPGPIERFELIPRRVGDSLQISGYDPGTYTLWVSASRAAPLILRNVALGSEDADLGMLPLRKGSTLKLRVRVNKPFVAPPIRLKLHRLDQPVLRAKKSAADGGRLDLRNLGAGRYKLEIECGPLEEDRVVTVDGIADREVLIDLR